MSILHGVPDATVDVYANGKALLENFEPGTLTDPQMLPAGSDLKVVKAGDGPDGDAIMAADNVKVPGGANVTVVAHLTERQADPHPIRQRRLSSSGRQGSGDCPARCGGPRGRRASRWRTSLH